MVGCKHCNLPLVWLPANRSRGYWGVVGSHAGVCRFDAAGHPYEHEVLLPDLDDATAVASWLVS